MKTYQEYANEKCANCERHKIGCDGCVRLAEEYIRSEVPSQFTDYESLGIPSWMIEQIFVLPFRTRSL